VGTTGTWRWAPSLPRFPSVEVMEMSDDDVRSLTAKGAGGSSMQVVVRPGFQFKQSSNLEVRVQVLGVKFESRFLFSVFYLFRGASTASNVRSIPQLPFPSSFYALDRG